MSKVKSGILAIVWLVLMGCSDSVEPDQGDLVRVAATSPSFTFTLNSQGQEEGEVEVDVTNLNDVPLYVFSACGNPIFRLQREFEAGWMAVGPAPSCMALAKATDVPAGESRLFSLKVLMNGALGDGTYRVDLQGMSWIPDPEEAFEATPLPLSSRLSNEFQIIVEEVAVDLQEDPAVSIT